jgi:hypothetical protein
VIYRVFGGEGDLDFSDIVKQIMYYRDVETRFIASLVVRVIYRVFGGEGDLDFSDIVKQIIHHQDVETR